MQKEQIIFFNIIIASIFLGFIFSIQYSENNLIYAQTSENEIIENTLQTVEKATTEGLSKITESVSNASKSKNNLLESNIIEENYEIGPSTLEEQLQLAQQYMESQPSQSKFNNLEENNDNNDSIQFFKSNAYSPDTSENIINNKSSSYKKYESKIIGIKLKYPSNWYLENKGDVDPSCMQQICKIVFYQDLDSSNNNFDLADDNNSNSSSSHSVGFIISSGSTSSPKFKEECKCDSLLEFVRSTYIKLFGNNENLLFINDNQTTITGNTSAWELEFDIKNIDDSNLEKQGKMWTIWTMNDNAFYHIGYVADKDLYSKYLPYAKQVVKTIEFIPIGEDGFKKPKHPSFMQNLNAEEKQESIEKEITTNYTDDQKEVTLTNNTISKQNNKELTSASSSLLEEKDLELAKEKLKDQTDKVNDVIIKSHTLYTDSMGIMRIVGEVQNNLPVMIESVKVIGTFYDNIGNVIGMDFTYTEPNDIESDEKAPFDLMLPNSTLLTEKLADYNLKVTWRK